MTFLTQIGSARPRSVVAPTADSLGRQHPLSSKAAGARRTAANGDPMVKVTALSDSEIVLVDAA
jgi:hypothetical protein